MKKAVFGGKFDPVHNGHLDIVRRSAALFDELIVGVYETPSTIFTIDERVQMFEEAVKDLPHVKVMPFASLIVDLARSQGAKILVRSMRGLKEVEQLAVLEIQRAAAACPIRIRL